jgi:hypothetical protein
LRAGGQRGRDEDGEDWITHVRCYP